MAPGTGQVPCRGGANTPRRFANARLRLAAHSKNWPSVMRAGQSPKTPRPPVLRSPRVDNPAAPSARPRPVGAHTVITLPQCRLVVIKGAHKGREFVLSGEVIRVGKAADNDVVLEEETVSRV